MISFNERISFFLSNSSIFSTFVCTWSFAYCLYYLSRYFQIRNYWQWSYEPVGLFYFVVFHGSGIMMISATIPCLLTSMKRNNKYVEMLQDSGLPEVFEYSTRDEVVVLSHFGGQYLSGFPVTTPERRRCQSDGFSLLKLDLFSQPWKWWKCFCQSFSKDTSLFFIGSSQLLINFLNEKCIWIGFLRFSELLWAH